MKKLHLCLLFITLSSMVVAQEKMYSPQELREDTDYYFSTLFRDHPDPYYFYPKRKFNKLKRSIYNDLNRPLNKIEFALVVGRINSFLDTHSAIPVENLIADSISKVIASKVNNIIHLRLNLPKDWNGSLTLCDSVFYHAMQNITPEKRKEILEEFNNVQYLIPPLKVRNNKLFFSNDSINSIAEINGISAKTIISETKKYFNKKLNPKTNSMNINSFINNFFLYKFAPPLKIKFNKRDNEEIAERIEPEEWVNEMLNVTEEIKNPSSIYAYEIYPENSVAIFHIPTFVNIYEDAFFKQFEQFKNEVNNQNIKYIFYNLTMNTGGHHMGGDALDIIEHETVYLRRKETTRNSNGKLEKENIDRWEVHSNYSNNIREDRCLFVLQNSITASSADYFCRLVADNHLGVLVGEPTGELTKTFSSSHEYTMPNTHISFNIASTLVDYSDYFKSLTTEPDIYWDLSNIREFTEQTLISIINYYKKEKTCIN